jgi:type IV secretion system protein TrbG
MKALLLAAAAAVTYPTAPVFGWRDGAVYQVLARPGRVTDIVLQPGEALSATNPVAAGDTVRWIVGDSESGAGPAKQVHVLVKPVDVALATNLVIATDRRTYHLELKSSAGAYMAAVAWRYPDGELVALRGAPPAPVTAVAEPKSAVPPPAQVAPEPDLSCLNFNYRLDGNAPFRPLRVFDDGRRTVIDFAPSISASEMPPLFVMSADGKAAELVNYRVQGRRMIVDRLFEAAELRLGAEKRQSRVRIMREAPRP